MTTGTLTIETTNSDFRHVMQHVTEKDALDLARAISEGKHISVPNDTGFSQINPAHIIGIRYEKDTP